jgi:hypothetical protein
VASSICLRATIFQNPEGTLWTLYFIISVEELVTSRGIRKYYYISFMLYLNYAVDSSVYMALNDRMIIE